MKLNIASWIKWSLLALLITALIGVIMRFKIGYEFPFFNQKSLQNAHTHLAFFGWVSLLLFVLLANFLETHGVIFKQLKRWLLCYGVVVLVLFIAHLVLGQDHITSILQAIFTVVFFTITIKFLNLLKQVNSIAKNWFRVALIAALVSFLGFMALGIMWVLKFHNLNYYLVATYWYLHFLYNGWFLFACFGFYLTPLNNRASKIASLNLVFLLSTVGLVSTFLLSVLWANLPTVIYVVAVVGAFAQSLATALLIKLFYQNRKILFDGFPKLFNFIGLLLLTALTIKTLLQLASVLPQISELAFGFRSIVIAYLHLILLGIVSVALIMLVTLQFFGHINKSFLAGFFLFIIGVYLTEIILAVQGIAAFSYQLVPLASPLLVASSVFILLSVCILFFSFKVKPKG